MVVVGGSHRRLVSLVSLESREREKFIAALTRGVVGTDMRSLVVRCQSGAWGLAALDGRLQCARTPASPVTLPLGR